MLASYILLGILTFILSVMFYYFFAIEKEITSNPFSQGRASKIKYPICSEIRSKKSPPSGGARPVLRKGV